MSTASPDAAGGTLRVDYDPAVWVEIPSREPDPDGWAVELAGQCWHESGADPSDDELTLLATRLLAVQSALADEPGLAFLHLVSPDPTVPIGPLARIVTLDAGHGDEQELLALAGADDPLCIEPPVVTRLDTPLGPALRCRRFAYEEAPGRLRHRNPPVALLYSFVWHLPQHGVDLRMLCTGADPGAAAGYEPDFDALAASLSLSGPEPGPEREPNDH